MTDKEKLEAMFFASRIPFTYDDEGNLSTCVDDYFIVYIFNAEGYLTGMQVERV